MNEEGGKEGLKKRKKKEHCCWYRFFYGNIKNLKKYIKYQLIYVNLLESEFPMLLWYSIDFFQHFIS